MTDLIKVFVYGTLKRNFHNHRLLTDQKFLGNAKTWNNYIMQRNGIPYVYDADRAYCGETGNTQKIIRGRKIKGELYEVNNEALSRIDQLEGHPSWYYRKLINITLESNNRSIPSCKAWLYFMRLDKSIENCPWFTEKVNIVDYYE